MKRTIILTALLLMSVVASVTAQTSTERWEAGNKAYI